MSLCSGCTAHYKDQPSTLEGAPKKKKKFKEWLEARDSNFLVLPNRPWKVISTDSRVIMGQFKSEREARQYQEELEGIGSLPMEVVHYEGTEEYVPKS